MMKVTQVNMISVKGLSDQELTELINHLQKLHLTIRIKNLKPYLRSKIRIVQYEQKTREIRKKEKENKTNFFTRIKNTILFKKKR